MRFRYESVLRRYHAGVVQLTPLAVVIHISYIAKQKSRKRLPDQAWLHLNSYHPHYLNNVMIYNGSFGYYATAKMM